jgi:acyl-CoA synthetase (AMP-forming)/AMP-acid ligase II
MSFDYIAFHAAERPSAVALVSGGREITYAQFHQNLARFTQAVRRFGLPQSSTVAVAVHVHWLLLLACEQLGIVTTSFHQAEGPSALAILVRMDMVLADPDFLTGADAAALGPRLRPLTPQVLDGIFALAPDAGAPAALGPAAPVRLLRTSGTTGVPKRMHTTRPLHETRITRWLWHAGFVRTSRLVLAVPFTAGTNYSMANACLRAGGTIIADMLEQRASLGQTLSRHGATHLLLAPIQLTHLLDELPADFRPPPGLTVSVFGARLAPVLRERALARLAVQVCDAYGCNETGIICTTNSAADGGFGSLWPGVAVEVVDGQDRPVPPGATGRVRVRTDAMVAGYLDDPEATSRMFRGGWFYPGDLGILHGVRQLRLIGRSDDLLNIGGAKFAPELLEDLVLRHAPVRDVGVCSIPNAQGIEEICIGVCEDGGDPQALLGAITHAFRGVQIGRFHVVRMAGIPRNPVGKIQRNLLRSAIRGVLA